MTKNNSVSAIFFGTPQKSSPFSGLCVFERLRAWRRVAAKFPNPSSRPRVYVSKRLFPTPSFAEPRTSAWLTPGGLRPPSPEPGFRNSSELKKSLFGEGVWNQELAKVLLGGRFKEFEDAPFAEQLIFRRLCFHLRIFTSTSHPTLMRPTRKIKKTNARTRKGFGMREM